jgi:hypothetical protein
MLFKYPVTFSLPIREIFIKFFAAIQDEHFLHSKIGHGLLGVGGLSGQAGPGGNLEQPD